MKIFATILIVFASCTLATAQFTSATFHMGAGTYTMGTQNRFQEQLAKSSDLPVRPKAVQSFPPYWTYGGSLTFKVSRRLGAGVWYEYGSTGGRLDYTDYSGNLRIDQLLRYSQVGLFYSLRLNRSEKWQLSTTTHFSVVRSKEKINFTIAVNDESDAQVFDLKQTSVGIRPGLMLQRKVSVFLFSASLGFELQIAGNLKDKDGHNLYLENNDTLDAQWTGLRGQLGVGIVLGKPRSNDQVSDL